MRNYKTQMEAAKKGIVTPEMETVAKKEKYGRKRAYGSCCSRSGGDPCQRKPYCSLCRGYR